MCCVHPLHHSADSSINQNTRLPNARIKRPIKRCGRLHRRGPVCLHDHARKLQTRGYTFVGRATGHLCKGTGGRYVSQDNTRDHIQLGLKIERDGGGGKRERERLTRCCFPLFTWKVHLDFLSCVFFPAVCARTLTKAGEW